MKLRGPSLSALLLTSLPGLSSGWSPLHLVVVDVPSCGRAGLAAVRDVPLLHTQL